MIQLIVTIFSFLSIAFFIAVFYYIKKRHHKITKLPNYEESVPENAVYNFLKFTKPPYKVNSPLFNKDLSNYSKEFKQRGIKKIILVHGTFVGNDPFHIVENLSEQLNVLGPKLASQIKEKISKTSEFFTGELGNFTAEYEKILNKNLGIDTNRFIWSSANNHIARVKAALDLWRKLENSPSKTVLIGHSHAGQIFALITSFIQKDNFAIDIVSLLLDKNEQREFWNQRKKIKNKEFIFLTLGSPSRYTFNPTKKHQILHAINHRGKLPIGGNLDGLLFTRDGDYIQQWGVVGSDINGLSTTETKLNNELSKILGNSSGIKSLLENIRYKRRLHEVGTNLLIDFEDKSLIPNIHKTALGHGIYTKKETLPFILEIILRYTK